VENHRKFSTPVDKPCGLHVELPQIRRLCRTLTDYVVENHEYNRAPSCGKTYGAARFSVETVEKSLGWLQKICLGLYAK